jgi:hypothetical protein
MGESDDRRQVINGQADTRTSSHNERSPHNRDVRSRWVGLPAHLSRLVRHLKDNADGYGKHRIACPPSRRAQRWQRSASRRRASAGYASRSMYRDIRWPLCVTEAAKLIRPAGMGRPMPD